MGVANFPKRQNSKEAAYVRCAELTVEVLLQGKWRIPILCALRDGSARMSQLGRLISGASKKVLAQNLRRFEADGIVIRTDMSDLVLHIEYELNGEVRELVCRLLDLLSETGATYLDSGEKKAPRDGDRS